MLEVTFAIGKLLNTSLYTMFLVYPCSLLKSLDKTTYNWPLLRDRTIQGIGTFVLITYHNFCHATHNFIHKLL